MTMPRSEPTIEQVETTDMTMAVFLIAKGLTPSLARKSESENGHPVGAWLFPSDEYTRSLIGQYAAGDATVEPRAFHKALNSARNEMFEFLGMRG